MLFVNISKTFTAFGESGPVSIYFGPVPQNLIGVNPGLTF